MFRYTFLNRTMPIVRATLCCAIGTCAFGVGIPSTIATYNAAGYSVPYTFETGANGHNGQLLAGGRQRLL